MRRIDNGIRDERKGLDESEMHQGQADFHCMHVIVHLYIFI